MKSWLVAGMAALLLAPIAISQEKNPRLGELPGSFVGNLPCADCPGIRYTLNLFPDGSYFTRMDYLEKKVKPFDDLGRWSLSEDGSKLTLANGKGSTESFAVRSTSVLRKLDTQGHEIQSKFNYDLKRAKAFGSIDASLQMDGMLKYSGDVGTFTECRTGQSWRVVAEGEYKALQSDHLKYQRQQGEELMASIEGQVTTRPRQTGKATDRTLVVQREIGIWPGEGCGQANVTANLQDTYWKLTRLEGTPVASGPRQREPNLVFRAAQNRVNGSGGCNNLNGGYTLKGNEITLGRVASTMMACADGMDIESKFLKSLEAVRTWKIFGQHLELYSADGTMVARFEARPPK